YEKAAKWLRKAADLGNGSGQQFLGKLYEEGKGVTKDPKEANKWFRKAAENGNVQAQFALGQNYRLGYGVQKDHKEAAIWFRKAAERGHRVAADNLATMYKNGLGVAQSDSEAQKWRSKGLLTKVTKMNKATDKLTELYRSYSWVKKCHEARKGYQLQYIHANELKQAKKHIKALEKRYKNDGANTDRAWDDGTQQVIKLGAIMGAQFTQSALNLCKLNKLNLSSNFSKSVGPKTIKKDF
ncbi:MAG: sel1 repeat family protein, partial [Rhodospirillales bacterium]|nr:sel1 repeat family protein [Rhodospirillales bacterium]